MREMKDSGIEWIGEIPADWNLKKLKHTFTISSGTTPKSDNLEYWDGDIPWVTPADYKTEDKYVYHGRKFLSEAGLNAANLQLLPVNSIIFSKRAPIGAVAITGAKLAINQGCISCVPAIECDIRYYYFILSIYTEQFNLLGSGTTFKEISAKDFGNFTVPAPSVSVQEKLADYLDRKCSQIDAIIARQQEVIKKLKAYRLSVITEAVTSTDSQMCRFRNCITTIEQGWSPAPAEIVGEDGWFVLSLSAVKNGKFNKLSKKPIDANENIPTQLSIKVGDLLMTRSNTRELVGDVCLVDSDCPKTIFSDLIYRISLNDTLLPCYAIFLLQSAFIRQQIQESARGSSGTMPKISHKSIKNLNIYLPSIPEQREISVFLRKKCNYIDTCIQKKERLIKKLTAYKKSIIYEVVTGKKRCKDE